MRAITVMIILAVLAAMVAGAAIPVYYSLGELGGVKVFEVLRTTMLLPSCPNSTGVDPEPKLRVGGSIYDLPLSYLYDSYTGDYGSYTTVYRFKLDGSKLYAVKRDGTQVYLYSLNETSGQLEGIGGYTHKCRPDGYDDYVEVKFRIVDQQQEQQEQAQQAVSRAAEATIGVAGTGLALYLMVRALEALIPRR